MSPHIPACVSLGVNNVKASRALRWSSISLRTQRCQGSGGQGLCHTQSLQWPPHSYLEHVCHTHSYAFAPLHPCLYLAVLLQRPGSKNTHTKARQHCHRMFMVTHLYWMSEVCWVCGEDHNFNRTMPKISDGLFLRTETMTLLIWSLLYTKIQQWSHAFEESLSRSILSGHSDYAHETQNHCSPRGDLDCMS